MYWEKQGLQWDFIPSIPQAHFPIESRAPCFSLSPVMLCSCLVTKSCVTHPLPMGFPRQEYWSGLPFPSLWDLPDPEIQSTGKWILYHWASDAMPPNMNVKHFWIPSCFNSNVTPLWILCLNLFFRPENRTLAHWMRQEWKLIYCHLVSCSNILWGFFWLPCSPPVILH